MEQSTRNDTNPLWSQQAVELAFKEYQLIVEDTARVTNSRQAASNMYTSVINFGFLAGEGYLLLQFIQDNSHAGYYIMGFLAIAVIATRMNTNWLQLSEQNRRLVDLRIRYLEQLERGLRDSGAFPPVDVLLKVNEVGTDGNITLTTRGVFTLEEVLYSPNAKRIPIGFSQAEQRIGRAFTLVYWLVFIFSLTLYCLAVIAPIIHITLPTP